MSDWFVHVEPSLMDMGVTFYLSRGAGKGQREFLGPDRKVRLVPENASLDFDTQAEVGWRLPDGASHALLAALAHHLGAVEHPEQLRRDYEAERKRVDTFIAFLTEKPE